MGMENVVHADSYISELSPPACGWMSSPVVVSCCPASRSALRAVNKHLINWPCASIILAKIQNDLLEEFE